MTGCAVRAATEQDASAIAAVYAPYVIETTATFELKPPDAAEFVRRLKAVRELGLPYLAADWDGLVVGYAYATQFRPRPAYRFTVEASVYIAAAFARRGIGRELLAELIEKSRDAGSKQMIAAIGGENPASVALHTAQGFVQSGVLRSVGFKFGQWLDVTLMQRAL